MKENLGGWLRLSYRRLTSVLGGQHREDGGFKLKILARIHI
jgi:hypothetical protein